MNLEIEDAYSKKRKYQNDVEEGQLMSDNSDDGGMNNRQQVYKKHKLTLTEKEAVKKLKRVQIEKNKNEQEAMRDSKRKHAELKLEMKKIKRDELKKEAEATKKNNKADKEETKERAKNDDRVTKRQARKYCIL